MPPKEPGSFEIHFGVPDDAPARPLSDSPFCLLLAGDFGGRAGTRDGPAARPLPFDRDDLDDTVARVAPAVTLATPDGGTFTLRFRSVDDLHPDALFETAPPLQALRRLRGELADPARFTAVSALFAKPVPASPRVSAGEFTSGASLLDRVVDAAQGPDSADAPLSRREDELAAFLRQVVAPHLVAHPDPRQAELLAGVDAAIQSQVRAILHAPGFQSLEANWRTAEFLARRLETGTRLRLQLLDLSRDELNADLDAAADPLETQLFRTLSEAARGIPDGGTWSVLAGLYSFSGDAADAGRLAALGRIAQALGAPWFAGADPTVFASASFDALADSAAPPVSDATAWATLRRSRQAHWIALATPRFLLRAPYGEAGEVVESFTFEEHVPAEPYYLWGGPAAACALLLAHGFTEDGWSMLPGRPAEIRGLPLYVYRENGEAIALPCTEALLTERAAERILEAGVMPLLSMRESDTIRLLRWQSLADPATSIAGPWTRDP